MDTAFLFRLVLIVIVSAAGGGIFTIEVLRDTTNLVAIGMIIGAIIYVTVMVMMMVSSYTYKED